jgi:hypothetical protein
VASSAVRRKQWSAGVVGVLAAVAGLTVLAVILSPRGPRPTLRLSRVSGPAATSPYDGAARIFWTRPDAVLINHWWLKPQADLLVVALRDGTRTPLPVTGKSNGVIESVSPDGRRALVRPPNPVTGQPVFQQFVCLESPGDPRFGSFPVTTPVDVRRGFAWTRDGKFWVAVGGRPFSSRRTLETFDLTPSTATSGHTLARNRKDVIIGVDAANRLLCVDLGATAPVSARHFLSPAELRTRHHVKAFAINAFPMDHDGYLGDPVRLNLPLPRHDGYVGFQISPDGRRIAYLVTKRWRLPTWAEKITARLRVTLDLPTDVEIWVADLDGSPPRLHASFPLPTRQNPNSPRITVTQGQFQWSPDGKQFGFLLGDDFYTYPAP